MHGPLGLARGVPGDAWLVSFNNSQRISYMAPWGSPDGSLETPVTSYRLRPVSATHLRYTVGSSIKSFDGILIYLSYQLIDKI